MKKRLFTMILLGALMINCSGCTNEEENTSVVEKQDEPIATIYSETEDVVKSPENFDDESKLYYIYEAQEVQDGVCVVTLLNENEEFSTSAVLDSEGNPLFCLSGAEFDTAFIGKCFVEQVGSYFYAHDVSDYGPNNYLIFDSSGNILFHVDFAADENLDYLDSGDGYLATRYKNSDFNSSDYRVSFYGLDGSPIREFSFPEYVYCEYYGSNVFKMSTDIEYEWGTQEYAFFYNAEIDSVFCADIDGKFGSGFSLKGDRTGFYKTDGTYIAFDQPLYFETLGINLYSKGGLSFSEGQLEPIAEWMNGIGVYENNEKYYIYNADTQKSYLLSELDRELYVYGTVYAANGYIALPIKGADDGIYTAIYDYEGKCVLPPASSEKDYRCISIADDKAFFSNDEEYLIYDLITGEVKRNQESGIAVQLTEYTNGIAIAQKYTDDGKSTYTTYVDEAGNSLFDYQKTQHGYYGDYFPYIRMNVENITKVNLNDIKTTSENEGFIYLPSDEFTSFDDLKTIFQAMTDNSTDDISQDDYLSTTIYPCDKTGQINCRGGIVAGFTTDYVVNGGSVGKVRDSLDDTWHVTAKNACDNYGITWYELWDSDDGDYYGWVDSSYIDFYGFQLVY